MNAPRGTTECTPGTGWDTKSKKCVACTGNTASPGGPSPGTKCVTCPSGKVANANNTACSVPGAFAAWSALDWRGPSAVLDSPAPGSSRVPQRPCQKSLHVTMASGWYQPCCQPLSPAFLLSRPLQQLGVSYRLRNRQAGKPGVPLLPGKMQKPLIAKVHEHTNLRSADSVLVCIMRPRHPRSSPRP